MALLGAICIPRNPAGVRGLLAVIALLDVAARTAFRVCFPHAFDQRGPRLDQRGPCAYESAARGCYLAERGPVRFPSSRCCPACALRQPFAGVSLVGGVFCSGTIGQGPLHIWDGGGLDRLASPGWPVSQLARL